MRESKFKSYDELPLFLNAETVAALPLCVLIQAKPRLLLTCAKSGATLYIPLGQF